ncbi:adenylate/guanylate cyclase domain-containing protein [Mesorhizobium sp. L-8-3]|uniref:adenylate/guanylate cyclase domain-containing protein n=1 Tax=Mesorhizobium sp. L-8-3 TaxID=2744522 RepID=UPI00406C0FD1
MSAGNRLRHQRLPFKVARRLRVLNIATWMAATLMAGFAAGEFLVASAGTWKVGIAYAIAAALLALIPLLHRFGPLVGPLAFAVVGYAIIFTICSMVGTDTGMPMQYLVAAAIMVLILGLDHLAISAALTVLAAVLIIVLELFVPADPGIRSTEHTSISLVANVVGSSAILFAIVLYAIRDAARAEAAAEREYERSESLLTSVLPESVAERLKLAPGAILVDRYDEASVLFADMAGFTARASEVSPEHLAACLGRVFGEFDRLVASHGLEKVKTSGDAYMVVSGVPRSRPDHAEVLADFAMAMRDMAMTLPDSQGQPVAIRIGMASGPVVAGVIGTSRMFYDLWGDAVNVASRMETTAPQGQIQVSRESYELLKDKFVLDQVGPLDIKGKGAMVTWLLRGRRMQG